MEDNLNLYEITQPEPSALVESLRAFGYSLKTALADLIDNSISAEAKNIWLTFDWDGRDSYITLKDDGLGMTIENLIEAMRPGSKSPLEKRLPRDLGRFGLGLKTASFSQCRTLYVVSKTKNTAAVARCWDLDYIKVSKEWRLIKNFEQDPLEAVNENITGSGTVIIWKKLDRIVGEAEADNNTAYKHFLEAIDEVKVHLSMVFHRFIDKSAGLKIWINGRLIDSWDPYLKNEKATQELPVERLILNSEAILVTPYVLPHQSKISQDTHRKTAGPAGWNAQQGYYIYRNERLLVPGDWLGLGFQKEEHCKLARIQIDLPNSLDGEWQIDVKKSRAKPPVPLRADLKRIAIETRERAIQIYRHRGKVVARRFSQQEVFLWQQKTRHGKYFYCINRDHPLVSDLYNAIGKKKIEPFLRVLEETVPHGHIMITSFEEPEKLSTPFEKCSYESIKPIMEVMYSSLQKSGFSNEDALTHLYALEPFSHLPEFIETFKAQIGGIK